MDGHEKVKVEVELDKALVDLASEAGLDLNDLFDRAMQRALGPECLKSNPEYAARLEAFQREIRPEIVWYNDHIERDGLFADEWRTF